MTSSFDPSSLVSTGTGSTSGIPYGFTIEGFDAGHFRVHAFTGREAISEHYAFDVVVSAETEADEEVERLALGRRAVLTWNVGKAPRAFYGVVAAVRLEEVHETHRSVQYHVRFVPRLWLLRRRRRSRIFQNLRVPEIVDAVLQEAGIPTRWQLLREYPAREYATQYEESDYRFVTRLLAEEGIYFYFPQGPELDAAAAADALVPGDTVIFGDDATTYPPIAGDDPSAFAAGPATAAVAAAVSDAPPLFFLALQSTATSHLDKILRFTARSTVRASSASFRDYDPDRPMGRPSSAATSTQPFPAPDPAAADPTAAPAAVLDLEVYEHHGRYLFPKWGSTGDEAALMLRQKRRRAFTAKGESGCPDLAPGHRFLLQDHPAAHLDRAYVVVAVDHHGQSDPQRVAEWKVYASTFECAPAEVTYVPPRPKRRSTQVALTATVVGPGSEEIYPDAVGQIKVQFHWDREGGGDERSSCWIRTMHAWGGAGWGTQFLPRVGMEVVVVFEGGDTDKPIVLGSLYNGTHPPPFILPGDRTRSGFRTQTSPGGNGYNELSFQDAAGREQIYTHAQRNLDEVVEKNHTLLVRNDEFLRITGSRMDTIDKNLTERIGGDSASQVGGARTSQVEGNRIDVVTGNSDERVSGMLVTRVEGKERRAVQHNADLEYGEDVTTKVKGCMTTLVGKADAQRSWVTHAEGLAKLSSLVTTEVSSEGELLLRVGKSSIRITADKIEIQSAAVTVKGAGGGLSAGDDGLNLTSKKDVQVLVDKKLVIKTSDGASLSMEKEIKADGKQILLNSPEQAQDPPPKDPDPPTKLELKDDEGKPLAYQRFLVVMDDGSEVSGVTDKDGKAEPDLKSGGKVLFPDLSMPGDKSDEGDLRPYVVRQGDYLTKLAFAQGFDVDEVWNHPKNEEVKSLRKDHHILAPGDVLQVPVKKKEGMPIQKGGANPYQAKVPKVEVKLCLRRGTRLLRNEPYTVLGLEGDWSSTTTDGDGKLTLAVPVTVREVEVILTRAKLRFPILIGDLDPLAADSGLAQRLSNLGHYRLRDDAEEREGALARAVRKFQRASGIEETGDVDDATRAALGKNHGH